MTADPFRAPLPPLDIQAAKRPRETRKSSRTESQGVFGWDFPAPVGTTPSGARMPE